MLGSRFKFLSIIIKTWSTHQIILQEKEKGFLELDFRKDNLHLNHKPWNRISVPQVPTEERIHGTKEKSLEV